MGAVTIVRKVFLALLPVVAAMAGPGISQAASWEQIVADAKKEGKVALYVSDAMGQMLEKALAPFTERYGIKVESLLMRSREVRTRLSVEVRAGRVMGDIAVIGSTSLAGMWDDGLLEHWLPPSINILPPELLKEAGVPETPLVPIAVNLEGVLINTNLVPTKREPKCWRDLLDPFWRGKIVLDDPRSAGAGHSWFRALIQIPDLGEAFHRRLAENKPFIMAGGGSTENARMVEAGQFSIGIPVTTGLVRDRQGLPVRMVIACEGMSYSLNGAAVAKGAPHPNAAKALLEFLISEETQRIIGRDRTPARKGIAGPRPEWSPDRVKIITPDRVVSAEERNKVYRLAEKLYGIR